MPTRELFPPSSSRYPRPPVVVLALLLAAGAAQGQTPASFGAVNAYSAGAYSQPFKIAVADVNGDGRLDIVTANYGTSTAGTLLGLAGGGFTTVSTFSTGTNSGPTGIAVADVNRDGRPDLVTANYGSNSVGVLLGLAGGGFAAVSIYPTSANSGPTSIAGADVNGDGWPDLITANYSSNTAGVLLGQIGGGFAAVNAYSTGTGSQPHGIAVADVNGDGRPDLVTANYGSNSVGVLLGLAGGGFAAVSIYPTSANSTPTDIAVVDVNGDRRPDIVTANYGNHTAGVLLGLASGGFAAVSAYSTGAGSNPQGIAVADVNGDGRPDLVTANTGSSTTGVLLGLAGGGFAPLSNYSTGISSQPISVAVADVNGDGRPDLLTASNINNSVGVLLNTGTYTPLVAALAAPAVEVTLFPNPAHAGFALQLPAGWGPAPMRAELRNGLGQLVAARSAASAGGTALTFTTDGLAPGVYVLRVQAGAHTLVKRVVVE